jgi:leishmanolysin-like peptidase
MFKSPYGERTPMIITPTVAKEAQAQFGCATVPGAALENEGGSGSAMAHWEYKWFQVSLLPACALSVSFPGVSHMTETSSLWCLQ